MNTENLILALVRDGAPVRPILRPAARSVFWIVLSVAWVATGVFVLGLRGDLDAALLAEPCFSCQVLLLLTATGLSAWLAFRLSIPGEKISRQLLLLSGLPFLLWAGWILLNAGQTDSGAGSGFHCVRNLLILGLPPSLLFFVLLKHALPLRASSIGLLAALGAAALADAGTCLICRHDSPGHILVWHFLPVLALGLVGLVAGSWIFRVNDKSARIMCDGNVEISQ